MCVVTGATNGIGFATAMALAKLGMHVIVVGRSPKRLDQAVSRIRAATGAAGVDCIAADLSVQQDVRQLAAQIYAKHDHLDVLVNNAGTIRRQREVSADRIEMTWAVNFLAPFLLTTLLCDPLSASGDARVVNVASHSHQRATIDFEDPLFARRPYEMRTAYGQSKLALVMFTAELAVRLAGRAVTVNSVHPGFVGSNFGSQAGGPAAILWRLMVPFLTSPAKGATTSVHVASSLEVRDITGQYFANSKPARYNPLVDNEQARARLWAMAEQMTADHGSSSTPH